MKLIILALAFLASSALCFATEELSTPITNVEFFVKLVGFLGGLSGITKLGIAAVAVQVAMLLLRGPLTNVAGVWRLTILTVLSWVGGILAQMSSGVPFMAAFTNAQTLAALQVWLHQAVTQVGKLQQDKLDLEDRIFFEDT